MRTSTPNDTTAHRGHQLTVCPDRRERGLALSRRVGATIFHGAGHFTVTSSDGQRAYTVQLSLVTRRLSCSCPDTHPLCKHVWNIVFRLLRDAGRAGFSPLGFVILGSLVRGTWMQWEQQWIGGHGWVDAVRAIDPSNEARSILPTSSYGGYPAHWGARWGEFHKEETELFMAALSTLITPLPSVPTPPRARRTRRTHITRKAA